jgi:TrmH family RNA methyltransferase
MQVITSRQNPVVREFRDLADRADAKGARLLLDGAHLVNEARAAGLAIEALAVGTSHAESDSDEGRLARQLDTEGVRVYSVTSAVLDAISPVRTPSGIVAIAARTPVAAVSLCKQPEGFLIAAIDVQDPGNLGSLIRAGEAGGATGVLACGASANPFSWKALRGSMGSALRMPVAIGPDAATVIKCAKGFGARAIASVLRGGDEPDAINWQGHVVLLLGGEGPGLSDDIASQCDARVTIPMAPAVESLNVAVAGAILVYAARRQRQPLGDAQR